MQHRILPAIYAGSLPSLGPLLRSAAVEQLSAGWRADLMFVAPELQRFPSPHSTSMSLTGWPPSYPLTRLMMRRLKEPPTLVHSIFGSFLRRRSPTSTTMPTGCRGWRIWSWWPATESPIRWQREHYSCMNSRTAARSWPGSWPASRSCCPVVSPSRILRLFCPKQSAGRCGCAPSPPA